MAAGSTNYPTALDTWVDHSNGDSYANDAHNTAHNSIQQAVIATQTFLGYGAARTPIFCEEVTFTETSGAGTYTGSVNLAAGSYLIDVIVHGTAVWNNAGACTLKVGDAADDDSIFTAVDLKATDLLAAEGLAASGVAATGGGKVGADLANTQWSRRWLAGARVISGIITTASTGGSTGRTRMIVIWAAPATTATAATKV